METNYEVKIGNQMKERLERKVAVHQRVRLNINYHTNVKNNINQPFTFNGKVCHEDCLLPNTSKTSKLIKKKFSERILDEDMTEDLEKIKAINWTRSNLILQAVAVPRDGNCLVHSVSLAIWGVEDDGTLRELLHCTILNDVEGRFKKRWSRQYIHEVSGISKTSLEIIDKEWIEIINHIASVPSSDICAAVPYHFLEAVHVYILSNILRRPIIVVGSNFVYSVKGQKLQQNSLLGIYLPLEWKPLECCKTPVLLGYYLNHFCPLLSEVYSGAVSENFLFPLVDKDLCFLPIRYLLEIEDSKAWQLIQSYMGIKELDVNKGTSNLALIPCAQMNFNPPSVNIFAEALKMCEEEVNKASGLPYSVQLTATTSANSPVPSSSTFVVPNAPYMSGFQSQPLSLMDERCRCGFRCSVQTYPYCHECVKYEQEKLPTLQNYIEPTAPVVSMMELEESSGESFEKISLLTGEQMPPSYTETTWQKGENIYIVKTSDVHEMNISAAIKNANHNSENIVGGIQNIQKKESVSQDPPKPGNKVAELQRESLEKLSGLAQKNVLKPLESYPQSAPSYPSQILRGKPCIVHGCCNFGDPAEDNMCSSCYRKKISSSAPKAKEVMTAVKSSPSSTASSSSYLPLHLSSQWSQRLHMQESGAPTSETAPLVSGLYDYSSPFNEGPANHELVTSISSKYSAPNKSNIDKTFENAYERTLFLQRNEGKCKRPGCSNFGNPGKSDYCNACFSKYQKEILDSCYGDDVPD